MKRLLFILFLFGSLLQAQTTYYVKNGGNDSGTGLSDAAAWATITKVNSRTFNPGDQVLFKRGDVWREEVSLVPDAGSGGSYVTYGAYDTGEKPKLLGSTLENNTGDWTVYSGNVWQNNDASFSVNVGNLIFNDEDSYGTYKTTLVGVASQGDYFFNVSTNVLYLYSTSNPADYYSNIECALDRHIIDFGTSKSYVILENLDIRYGAGHGVSGYNGCSYITVKDCDFSFIGGGYFEDGAARYGNAVQFWQSSNYITVERCTFDNIYDAAITPQFSGAGTANISNWQVRHNLINRSEYSFEGFIGSESDGSWTNIYVQNNTMRNAGGGFGHNQRPDAQRGSHIQIWIINATTSNFYIRNNIFDVAEEYAMWLPSDRVSTIVCDYNCFNVDVVAYNGSTEYTTIASWRTYSGDDANSISDDPELVSSVDWHLTATSPCIGEGVNTGYSTDFDLVGWVAPYDIGAYKYVGGGGSDNNYYVKTYISGGRDEEGRDGSIGEEWATLSYACGRVAAGENTINIASGNYTDNYRAALALGVSIKGDASSPPNITTSYVAGSESDAYLYLYSASIANGNQSISYININGNSRTATRGVWIGYRHNVDIHHCTIEYFKTIGVHYRNEINWETPPVTYATGSNFYDNTVRGCSGDRDLGGNGCELRLDGQTEMNVYNCNFYSNTKPAGQNGDTWNMSFCKGVKTYNCNFYRLDHEADQWNFYSEHFHLRGGIEIYDCNFFGSGNVDFSNAFDGSSSRGTYAFTVSIHDCYFTTTTGNQISTASIGHVPIAITVEKGDWEYVYIYNNYIKAYASGIYIDSNNDVDFNHIYIYCNIFEHLGSTGYTYTWGIAIFPEGVSTVSHDNIHFWNNVITGGSGYNHTGIRWAAQGTLTNSSIKNNIIYDFDNYPIYFDIQAGRTFSMTNVDVTYNNFYSNSPNSVYVNGSISRTNVDVTTGNITTDPLFTGGSPYSYKLQEESDAVASGEFIGAPMLTDYDGVTWLDPPNMGAYERVSFVTVPVLTTSVVTDITATTATGGGNISSDGGASVTARGVCWSTSATPTIADSHTSDGTGTGTFASAITGLTDGFTYYVRAYATNTMGTAYGNARSFVAEEEGKGEVSIPLKHLNKFIIINGQIVRL